MSNANLQYLRSFDMPHFGHANALRQARLMGDELVVGVHCDGVPSNAFPFASRCIFAYTRTLLGSGAGQGWVPSRVMTENSQFMVSNES